MLKGDAFFYKVLKGNKGTKMVIRFKIAFQDLFALFYPLVLDAVIKPPREAHHTFEAKLRNASTLLRLGRTNKLALLSP